MKNFVCALGLLILSLVPLSARAGGEFTLLGTDGSATSPFRDVTVGVSPGSSPVPAHVLLLNPTTGTPVSNANPLPVSGTFSAGTYPPFEWFDANPVLTASSTNIPLCSSSTITVVAALSAAVHKLCVTDTTGQFIHVLEGSTLRYVASPGEQSCGPDVSMSSGSAVKLCADSADGAAITTGLFMIQFR